MTDAAHDPRAKKDSLKVQHEGRVVAAAEVTAPPEPHGKASVALTARRGEAPPEARSELVDQVLDHPGVRQSDSVHVVVPLGDGASLTRLQERTTNFDARAAGASSIIEADVAEPPAPQ
ncbi:hypothetical protein [Microlunatus antarcticus]|uniref:Uncharacterized protein n=1 Tax=Microlunatus antarcticus TaxID=53388 RepID=A0A7W5P7Y1_9ACTN|nr:hypothetical protein [Microlunatus antarcticus]MBB3327998.1 hypothetical protein [Microlunatus antarcticus]